MELRLQGWPLSFLQNRKCSLPRLLSTRGPKDGAFAAFSFSFRNPQGQNPLPPHPGPSPPAYPSFTNQELGLLPHQSHSLCIPNLEVSSCRHTPQPPYPSFIPGLAVGSSQHPVRGDEECTTIEAATRGPLAMAANEAHTPRLLAPCHHPALWRDTGRRALLISGFSGFLPPPHPIFTGFAQFICSLRNCWVCQSSSSLKKSLLGLGMAPG